MVGPRLLRAVAFRRGALARLLPPIERRLIAAPLGSGQASCPGQTNTRSSYVGREWGPIDVTPKLRPGVDPSEGLRRPATSRPLAVNEGHSLSEHAHPLRSVQANRANGPPR